MTIRYGIETDIVLNVKCGYPGRATMPVTCDTEARRNSIRPVTPVKCGCAKYPDCFTCPDEIANKCRWGL